MDFRFSTSLKYGEGHEHRHLDGGRMASNIFSLFLKVYHDQIDNYSGKPELELNEKCNAMH